MADRLPLIQNAGQLSQLRTPDLLVDVDGHGYVDAAAAFGTDDVLVASDGTARGCKATAIDKDNVVQADTAFGTDDRVIISDGTAKNVEASSLLITELVTADTPFGTDGVLIISDGTGNGVEASAILVADVVTADTAFGTDNLVVISDGTGKGVEASTLDVDVIVQAASAFGTDDVLIASDGTGRGTKATAIDKDDVVTADTAFGTDDRIIIADGTGKGVEASSLLISDVATLATRWLVATATKTANYDAAVNDLVVCDCSGGSFTVTLPTPSNNDEVGVLLLADTVPNTVTIDSDGGSILGKNGSQGATIDLYIENDYVRLKYLGSNVWQLVDDERTLHYAHMRGDATTGQTVPHNTTTVIDFATEVEDNAGLSDVTTNEVTIRRAGTYSITASAGVASGAVLEIWNLNLRLNGSNIRGATSTPAAVSSNVVHNFAANVRLAAGDVLTMSCVQQSSDSSDKTILLTEAATSRIFVQEIR